MEACLCRRPVGEAIDFGSHWQNLHIGSGQRLAHGLLVIDHQPKVTPIVTGLLAAFLKSKELIAQIDERCVLALAAQLDSNRRP
jgi:hypothetical protein